MQVSFITVRETPDHHWEILRKTFPGAIRKFAPSIVLIRIESDQKTAEVAAKKFAEIYKCPYVSHNECIVTLAFVGGSFFPIELKPDNTVVSIGNISDYISACEKAKESGLRLLLSQD